MMPMTPVLPSGSAPLESAPSLEILQSEDEAHEVAKEAEALEPSTRDLLQAMTEFHESVVGRLERIDQWMERWEERISKRRPSACSARSALSKSTLRPSTSGRKYQAPSENLAIQALQMDISSLVPVHHAKKTTGSESFGVTSWALGKKKQKDKTKKGGEKGRDRSTGRSGERNERKSSKESKEGDKSDGQTQNEESENQCFSSPGPAKRQGSLTFLEVPGVPCVATVRSDMLGPVESGSEADVRPTSTGAQRSQEFEGKDVKDVQVSDHPGDHPSFQSEYQDSPKSKVNTVLSARSGGDGSLGEVGRSGGAKSSKSKRSSISLNRAVSKANITEVFKVREMELTAGLHEKNEKNDEKIEKHEKSSHQKKVVSVASLVDEPLAEVTSQVSESDSESEASEMEAEAVETDGGNWESFWLKLSPVNTFMTCHLSKALALVPLFDPELEKGPAGRTWSSCLKKLASRLYHWIVILFLMYCLVDNVRTLTLCRDAADIDLGEVDYELCHRTWPPLAVDIALLIGAILVLFSWGGLLRYVDTTQLVAQSGAELSSYCSQKGLDLAWKTWSCKDALWTLLLWCILVAARYIPCAWNSLAEGRAFAEWTDLPRLVSHALLTGILVVASFWQVRTSHAMLLILNSWIASLLGGEIDCMEAKHQWRRVSGLFRKTSRTFEHCFAALASLIVALALSALYDLRQGQGLEVVCGSAAVVFILPGVLWTHASTTTACNRLPSLVTLCEVDDEEEDAEYMGLAMYLSLSECGFFVWDTCVTVAFVQKFLYFASALAGTIGFQTGALKLS